MIQKIKKILLSKDDLFYKILLITIGIFFFFFVGEDKGYVLQKDSPSYLEGDMAVGIMPIYPGFLKFQKCIFGEDRFLDATMIVQGIVAIFCSIYLAEILGRVIKLKKRQITIIYILSFLPYAYSLPQNVVSHEIMTEALAFPLLYLYYSLILEGILNRNIKKINISVILLIVLLGLRKQFLFLFFVNIIVYLWYFLSQRKVQKRLLMYGISLFAILGGVVIIGSINFPKVWSVFDGSQIVDALIGKTIYVSDIDDIELFETEELKGAFESLYSFAEEGERLLEYAENYNGERWVHVTEGMNQITANSWPILYDYCSKNSIEYEYIESIQTELMCTLLIHHWDDLIIIFGDLIMQSLVSAVFIKKTEWYTACKIIAMLIYILGVILRLLCRRSKDQTRSVCIVFDLTMLILLSNIFILNLIFMGLQRYVVYTFGLFYIALYLMFMKLREKESSIKIN